MKRTPLGLYLLLWGACLGLATGLLSAQESNKQLDPRALQILDGMADRIGQMGSCRFVVDVALDTVDPEFGPVRYFNHHEVAYSGPERFSVLSNGQNGHNGFWYNGLDLAYYDFDKELYGLIPVPEGSSIEAIESAHQRYGIDFPAADFLFPTFTDDLIAAHDRVAYLGVAVLGNRRCHHIVAKGKDRNVQLWIEETGSMFPVRMVIFERKKNRWEAYSAAFGQWEVNPSLPAALFDFPAPFGARPLRILSKN